jgi:PAS domain S-box-containing protein
MRVLLIEDEPSEERLVRDVLRLEAPEITVESTDRLTPALARLAEGDVDVVLLDLGLPDAQGLEAVERIRAQTAAPIIVFTGLDDDAMALAAVAGGAQDYLVKGQHDGPLLLRAMRYALERQRLVTDLEAARSRLEHLLRYSPSILFAGGWATGGWTTELVSGDTERLLGYAPEEVAATDFGWREVHPDDHRTLIELGEAVRRDGVAVRECRIRHRDGSWRWVQTAIALRQNETVAAADLIGCATDVTDRKLAELALRERLEQQEAVARLGQLALSGAPLDLLVTEAAHAVAATLRTPSAEICQLLPDRTGLVLRAASGRRAELVGAHRLGAGEESFAGYTLLAGAPLVVEDLGTENRFRAVPFERAQGAVSALSVIVPGAERPFGTLSVHTTSRRTFRREDVTFLQSVANVVAAASERTEREDALRTSNRELVEARDAALAANRAKSELLANVGHELRTPMNGVIGVADVLLETTLGDEQREYVTLIHNSANQLLSVINDILSAAQLHAGTMRLEEEDFDLRAIVDEVAELAAPAAFRRGLELVVSLPPALPTVLRGDARRLRQIVAHLVDNAIKFTTAGEVRIEAQTRYETAGYVALRLVVSDTGIGIPLDRQQTIFESFTQVDGSSTRARGGVGLGLTVSRQLAELMNGTIGLESTPQAGSRFWLDVSLARQSTCRPGEAGPVGAHGRRALVVDPSAACRRSVAEQLVAFELRVDEAADATAAGALLKAAATDPIGLIVADARSVRAIEIQLDAWRTDATSRIPVVVMSLPGSEVDLGNSRLRVVKPVRAGALLATLRAAFDGGRTSPEGGAGGTRVLVVEHDAVDQRLLGCVLERLGCAAVAVGTAHAALAEIEAAAWELVLVDVGLPAVDVATVVAAARAATARTQRPLAVIALAAPDGDERARCLAAGIDDYLVKPISSAKLAEIVSRWERRRPAPAPVPEPCPRAG